MSDHFFYDHMKDYPRIVFFGTPDFAVTSLRRIVEEGFHVAAVITAPDKPAGRGMNMATSPVKRFADEAGLPVLQPVNMKDPVFADQLKSLKPDLQIVIAFRMMPKSVWSLPPLGTFNLHASLLPQYRGAAPINRAIMNGEKETGVTTFFLNEKVDTGRILFSEAVTIGQDETAGELHDRLMLVGAELVVKTVNYIISGNTSEIPQESLIEPGLILKEAPKIFKEDCTINWNDTTLNLYNFIRGLTPSPGAFCIIKLPDCSEQMLKIYQSVPEIVSDSLLPGKFISDGKTDLKVRTADGFLHLERVQLSGRKPMNIGDFLRGYGALFS